MVLEAWGCGYELQVWMAVVGNETYAAGSCEKSVACVEVHDAKNVGTIAGDDAGVYVGKGVADGYVEFDAVRGVEVGAVVDVEAVVVVDAEADSAADVEADGGKGVGVDVARGVSGVAELIAVEGENEGLWKDVAVLHAEVHEEGHS